MGEIKGKSLRPDAGFIRKQLTKENIETPIKNANADEQDRQKSFNNKNGAFEEEIFKEHINQDTNLLNSTLKRKKKLMEEFEALEKKKTELLKKKEILDKKHKKLNKEDELFKHNVQNFKNEEKKALAELTKDEEMVKNDLEYIKDESRLDKEISRKVSKQPFEEMENLDKTDLDSISSLLEKEKQLHDKIQDRLEKRYSEMIMQDLPGPANELFNYIRKHREWLEKKAKELERGTWDNLDSFFQRKPKEKETTAQKKEKQPDNHFKKQNKETSKKKTTKNERNQKHKGNEDDAEKVKEVDSLIGEVMTALAMDNDKKAKEYMKKAKNIYINFEGNIIDKQRIYEELTELQKLMTLKRTNPNNKN
ncbi:MAG: hypothetical protein ACOCQG_00245 [Candidatus Nanoarchaeia archaeon]